MTTDTRTSTYGDRLRVWRNIRGVSQLDLANRAGVSQRHISFLETGRSKPSREMVTHLVVVLDVPPREHNQMLTAAGHAPAHRETQLEDIDAVSQVIDTMLEGHMPNPAIVVDRQWNLVRSNGAAAALTGRLFTEVPSWLEPPLNVMRMTFHPEGLRPHIVRWEDSAAVLLRRLEADALVHPHDAALQDLVDEILEFPDVRDLQRRPPSTNSSDLLVPITYRVGDDEISFFTTIARIGDAHDLTLAELRIETFWPLDEQSRRTWAAVTNA